MTRRNTGFAFWPIAGMAAVIIVASTEAAACSGPGAAAFIRNSELIGFSLAVGSFIAIGLASIQLTRYGRVIVRNVLLGLAVIHPGFWESARRGDCGYSLVTDSLLMTAVMGMALASPFLWRRRTGGAVQRRRGAVSRRRGAVFGGLAGAIAGALFVSISLSGSLKSADALLVAGWSFVSIVAAGALIGRRLCSVEDRPWYRPRFRLRSLMVFLLLVAPILAVLLPTRRYESSLPMSTPTRFFIIDEKTGQPVEGATVRLIDLRYSENDLDMQDTAVVTGADGHADLWPTANRTSRVRLLGRIDTISFDPVIIRVDSANYQRFQAPLSANTSIRPKDFTDPPLCLAIPPPKRAIVGLKQTSSRQGSPGGAGPAPSHESARP